MGLDITAYKGIELVETLPNVEEFEDKYDWRESFDYIYPDYVDFIERLPPIVLGGVYKYESEFDFPAGSYSGYNEWRDELSRMALDVPASTVWNNESEFIGKPFCELINFSDCEGVLGTDVCKKLLKDFEDYQEQANSYQGVDEFETQWFIQRYNDWRKAFEYAADNGYVYFY